MNPTIVRLLDQDQVWLNGQPLTEMDPHHRANLIPFLRGNAKTLQRLAEAIYWDSSLAKASLCDGVTHVQLATEAELAKAPEDWLNRKPLMVRLCEMEQGRPLDDRRETHERNQAYEQATGYQKIRCG